MMRLLLALRLLGLSASTVLKAPRHLSVLKNPFQDVDSKRQFYVRQVPGDGSCLFHTLAASIHHRCKGSHPDFDNYFYNTSRYLRQLSVDTLESNSTSLYICENETCSTSELLSLMAEQYNTTMDGYCRQMRNPFEWGGGPEIVALSNLLRLPIHVYQLRTRRIFPRTFMLQLQVKFGSPKFESADCEPVRILCCDGRFPNLKPGNQNEVGDHFMPLFPALEAKEHRVVHSHRIRRLISNIMCIIRNLVFGVSACNSSHASRNSELVGCKGACPAACSVGNQADSNRSGALNGILWSIMRGDSINATGELLR